MLPDRVSNPGPLTYESGTLPIALRGPAFFPSLSETARYRLQRAAKSKTTKQLAKDTVPMHHV